jgi:nucleoside-diphosphate-sugar epimerase
MLFHVTGANGLVGKEVVSALSALGEVRGTDVGDMDVTDFDAVKKDFEKSPPDVVVHLAGIKGNLPSRERPLLFFGVNTMGTLNLLEASRLAGVKHFIFFSSLTVHGPVEAEVNEDSPLNPQHPYSGSKGAGESMVSAYANGFGMRGTNLRPNFIVGPIPAPLKIEDNLVYDFIDLCKKGEPIRVAGHGQYEREWMHPKDVAKAVALAASTPGEGCQTYILRGERVTMQQFAERIVKHVGQGSVTTNPDMGGFSIISSGEKAKRELGFEAEIDLDSVIAEVWAEYQVRHG